MQQTVPPSISLPSSSMHMPSNSTAIIQPPMHNYNSNVAQPSFHHQSGFAGKGGGRGRGRPLTCFGCGEEGHTLYQCPRKNQTKQVDEKTSELEKEVGQLKELIEKLSAPAAPAPAISTSTNASTALEPDSVDLELEDSLAKKIDGIDLRRRRAEATMRWEFTEQFKDMKNSTKDDIEEALCTLANNHADQIRALKDEVNVEMSKLWNAFAKLEKSINLPNANHPPQPPQQRTSDANNQPTPTTPTQAKRARKPSVK